jgi:hypothetical protein
MWLSRDADHRAYDANGMITNVDGLIRISKQKFKWLPVKPRCHTKDLESRNMGRPNQPMTCSVGPGAARGLKIGEIIMADKSKSPVNAIHLQIIVVKSSSDSDQKEVIGPRELGSNTPQCQQGTNALEKNNIAEKGSLHGSERDV